MVNGEGAALEVPARILVDAAPNGDGVERGRTTVIWKNVAKITAGVMRSGQHRRPLVGRRQHRHQVSDLLRNQPPFFRYCLNLPHVLTQIKVVNGEGVAREVPAWILVNAAPNGDGAERGRTTVNVLAVVRVTAGELAALPTDVFFQKGVSFLNILPRTLTYGYLVRL